jgi:glycosyltransferase involved in cell wall biosynthesis
MKNIEKIRIGLDCFLLSRQNRGIANYIYRLTKLIKKNKEKNIIFFFFKPKIKTIILNNKYCSIFLNIYIIIWEQLIFPIKAKLNSCNYVIYPANTGSLFLSRIFNLKFILVLHDIYFTLDKNKYPQYFNLQQYLSYLYRRLLIKGLIDNAFKIITVSNFAKKMIESYDIKASNKIFVIKNSIDKKNIIKITKKKIQKSILLVTGFHPQKNLQHVLPFILKKLKGFSIFIVGISFKNLSKIVEKNILKLGKQNNNIKIYDFLDKKNLNKLYLRSEIFLMPSIYESFSIPLLEACYFRNIILCSNTGATKETTKNKAIYYNNQNLLNLTKKINNIAKLKNFFKKKILKFQYLMLSNNDDFLDNKNFKLLLRSL